jgi:arylsulfatase A-like enzyme
MDAVRRWIDGYDTGIRYADEHLGQLLTVLDDAGAWDETAVVVSADHGENQGELNVWGDHHVADHWTSRVPLIVRWPGIGRRRVDTALHYQFDWAATTVELCGRTVPANWDGESFAAAFSAERWEGRPYLVLSQGAWTCMRSVRWDRYLCMRTYHDGYSDLDEVMLFDLAEDEHEQHNLADECPALVEHAMGLLAHWQESQMLRSTEDVDPLMTVLREGGPYHTRGRLSSYAERLRATGRAEAAERILRDHPGDLSYP